MSTYTFITGASSGMGAATAKLLSETRNLLLHGRDLERLEETRRQCAAHGHDVQLFPYDLQEIGTLRDDLAAFLTEKGIRVGEFLHFAGMTEVLPISKTKYSIGLKVMNVNYFSATEIISTLLKKKVNADALANIVLVSSLVSKTGVKYQPHYCSSKGAIDALTIALACELAPKVRVNCITPGSFKTRIMQTTFAAPEEDWQFNTLIPHSGPHDIAKVARFLLSEDSRYTTGQNIFVDGGERFFGTLSKPAWISSI